MGDEEPVPLRADGHLTLPSARWDRVLRQAEVIRCLAECADDAGGRGSGCRVATIDEAAAELGVSRRQMYVLLQRFRAGSGRATDLMPASPDGGRGRGRLDYRVEAIVAETIRKRFLSRQKRSVAVIHREIRQACVAQGLLAPSRNTVAAGSGVCIRCRSRAAGEDRMPPARCSPPVTTSPASTGS